MRKLSVLGFILGILIVLYIVFYSDASKVFAIIIKIDPSFYVIAFIIELFILFLFIERLKIIINKQNNLGFFKVAKISVYANAINLLTPVLRIGGEPLKIRYLKKEKIDYPFSSSYIAIEILSEVLGLYIIFLVSLFISFILWNLPYIYFISGCLSFLIIFFLTLFVLKFLFSSHRIEKFLIRFLDKSFAKKTSKQFSKNLKLLLSNKSLLYKTIFISIIIKILEILRIYFVMLSIVPSVKFNLAIILWTLYVLLGLLPWLPGNLGIIEGGAISILLYFGWSLHLATSLILLERILSLWFPVFIGFLYKGFEKFYYACKKR